MLTDRRTDGLTLLALIVIHKQALIINEIWPIEVGYIKGAQLVNFKLVMLLKSISQVLITNNNQ